MLLFYYLYYYHLLIHFYILRVYLHRILPSFWCKHPFWKAAKEPSMKNKYPQKAPKADVCGENCLRFPETAQIFVNLTAHECTRFKLLTGNGERICSCNWWLFTHCTRLRLITVPRLYRTVRFSSQSSFLVGASQFYAALVLFAGLKVSYLALVQANQVSFRVSASSKEKATSLISASYGRPSSNTARRLLPANEVRPYKAAPVVLSCALGRPDRTSWSCCRQNIEPPTSPKIEFLQYRQKVFRGLHWQLFLTWWFSAFANLANPSHISFFPRFFLLWSSPITGPVI